MGLTTQFLPTQLPLEHYVGSDLLTGALSYTGTNVGSYPITIGTLANSNYTINLASVNFAITQATQAAVTLSSLSAAYNPSNKTVSLTGSGGSGTGSYTYALDSIQYNRWMCSQYFNTDIHNCWHLCHRCDPFI